MNSNGHKERPILFSGPMVRAILQGRKTQTRRVVKPQPEFEGRKSFGDSWAWRDGKDWFSGVTTEQLVGQYGLCYGDRCPYGKAGDRLWVRETFYAHGGQKENTPTFCGFYRATDPDRNVPWKPSIFMPRWASRITLEITNVRVERLQEISAADIDAEGVSESWWPDSNRFAQWQKGWDALNAGRKGCAWADNPWVWCISFRRIS